MKKLVILTAMALVICVGSVDAHEVHPGQTLKCNVSNKTNVHMSCLVGTVNRGKKTVDGVNHKHFCIKKGKMKGKPGHGECKK
jgi:hypothetical protein